VPARVRDQNLGLKQADAEQLPDHEVYFAQGPPPADDTPAAVARPEAQLITHHRYPLMAQEPRRSPGGGTQRTVTVEEFPISTTMAGSVIELEPGALRELHWHPNADEWQYYLEGQAEMTVFLSQGQAVTEQFRAGDAGYAPMGAGHYILNTGADVCRVLVGFNSGHYQAIDLSAWLSTNPRSTLAANLSLPDSVLDKLPHDWRFIVPSA
jgi:oxalate decarboxylase